MAFVSVLFIVDVRLYMYHTIHTIDLNSFSIFICLSLLVRANVAS